MDNFEPYNVFWLLLQIYPSDLRLVRVTYLLACILLCACVHLKHPSPVHLTHPVPSVKKLILKKKPSYCICLSYEYILKEVICVVYVSAGPKAEVVGAISVQEFQENVFVEGNRPKYVLDLHTEAQQGLKMQQQEGQKVKLQISVCLNYTLLLWTKHMHFLNI